MPDREDTEYATSSRSEKLIVALNFFLEASFFRKCLSCTNRLIKKKKKRGSNGDRLSRYGRHGST